MIPSAIFGIIISYLDPLLISTFFRLHKIPLTIKFKYNAALHNMKPNVFNNIFSLFPNIIFTGINIFRPPPNYHNQIFPHTNIPLIPHTIKIIKLSGFHDQNLPNFEPYINMRSLSLRIFWIPSMPPQFNSIKLHHLDLQYTKCPPKVLTDIIITQPRLRSLHLPSIAITDFSHIIKLQKLSTLSIPEHTLSFLSAFKTITHIILHTNNGTFLPILSCPNLHYLTLNQWPNLHTISNPHLIHPLLQHIKIINCDNLSSITNLSLCTNLISITIKNCTKLQYINAPKRIKIYIS